MKWYCRPVETRRGRIISAGFPILEADGKNEAKELTKALLEEEGLDWQAGNRFKTRSRDVQYAWFDRKVAEMKW